MVTAFLSGALGPSLPAARLALLLGLEQQRLQLPSPQEPQLWDMGRNARPLHELCGCPMELLQLEEREQEQKQGQGELNPSLSPCKTARSPAAKRRALARTAMLEVCPACQRALAWRPHTGTNDRVALETLYHLLGLARPACLAASGRRDGARWHLFEAAHGEKSQAWSARKALALNERGLELQVQVTESEQHATPVALMFPTSAVLRVWLPVANAGSTAGATGGALLRRAVETAAECLAAWLGVKELAPLARFVKSMQPTAGANRLPDSSSQRHRLKTLLEAISPLRRAGDRAGLPVLAAGPPPEACAPASTTRDLCMAAVQRVLARFELQHSYLGRELVAAIQEELGQASGELPQAPGTSPEPCATPVDLPSPPPLFSCAAEEPLSPSNAGGPVRHRGQNGNAVAPGKPLCAPASVRERRVGGGNARGAAAPALEWCRGVSRDHGLLSAQRVVPRVDCPKAISLELLPSVLVLSVAGLLPVFPSPDGPYGLVSGTSRYRHVRFPFEILWDAVGQEWVLMERGPDGLTELLATCTSAFSVTEVVSDVDLEPELLPPVTGPGLAPGGAGQWFLRCPGAPIMLPAPAAWTVCVPTLDEMVVLRRQLGARQLRRGGLLTEDHTDPPDTEDLLAQGVRRRGWPPRKGWLGRRSLPRMLSSGFAPQEGGRAQDDPHALPQRVSQRLWACQGRHAMAVPCALRSWCWV